MLFQTTEFAVFFLVVSISYFLLPFERRNWFLLAASYFFYMSWDARFAGLILASTLIDYACCIGIENATAAARSRRRRLFLVLSVASNLSILGFFKYFHFFADGLVRLVSIFAGEDSALWSAPRLSPARLGRLRPRLRIRSRRSPLTSGAGQKLPA